MRAISKYQNLVRYSKNAECAYCVILEVRVLQNLRADLSTSEVVLTRGIAEVVCALLRAMYLGQDICAAK